MSFTGVLVEVGSPRAHPVTGHPHVEVPLVLLTVGVTAAVALALLLTPRSNEPRGEDRSGSASWTGPLTAAQVAVRVVSVVLLALAVAAGRFGSQNELENLAPALVVGAGWPLLTVASLAAPVWRWLDPWDTLARVLAPGDDSEPPGHVWPAVALAAAWCWFLAVYARPLDPRAVGLALLGYTTLTLAGCLLLGRRRWLASGEPIGILLSWVTAAGRARLGSRGLPRGAGVLLGVTLGGLLFAILRRTEVWSGLAGLPQGTLLDTAGFAGCCALGAGLLGLGGSVGNRLGDHGAVLCGSAAALVGVVTAVALERNRLFTSVQLLPGLLGDPFGLGWDLLGPAGQGLDPAPLGAAGLIVAQVAALGVGLVWGAIVAARRSPRSSRLAAGVVLGYLAAVSVVAVSLH